MWSLTWTLPILGSPVPRPVAMVDPSGATWWLAAIQPGNVYGRDHHQADADHHLVNYRVNHMDEEIHPAAVYTGMQALFGPSNDTYDDYKGSFRWFIGVWADERGAAGAGADWLSVHDVRDHKGSIAWIWRFAAPPDPAQTPWLTHGSIALLILATAVGEHLRTRGINGRTLPDFRLAVPAIHQRYGATNQAWLWEEATDRQPRPVPPPELGQRVIIASPVSWLDVVPDPAGAVWPDPIQGVMLQMILSRCCSDWRLECPDRAAYHAKIRQFFCELHAQPGAAPGVPPLNATQEAMLETWCLRRWGDHD